MLTQVPGLQVFEQAAAGGSPAAVQTGQSPEEEDPSSAHRLVSEEAGQGVGGWNCGMTFGGKNQDNSHCAHLYLPYIPILAGLFYE